MSNCDLECQGLLQLSTKYFVKNAIRSAGNMFAILRGYSFFKKFSFSANE